MQGYLPNSAPPGVLRSAGVGPFGPLLEGKQPVRLGVLF